MTDDITENMTKLGLESAKFLDEVTGEMVSKNELKKRTTKRARKLRKTMETKPKNQGNPKDKDVSSKSAFDTEPMFKQGFLADVYKLRPSENVVTRFPPEPNGYLHLGHCKAIAINFGFARYHGGKTILRFDDTNPDAEKQEYTLSIKETIRWLGFTPSEITYASDNFQRLYDLAELLIHKEKAYVCHCNEAETKLQRGGEDNSTPRYRCKHAEQTVATNLSKFRAMRDGDYKPQAAWLRMKQDIDNPNPQMWDIAAYRIPKDQAAHARTGTKWRIYPTYDFAHCLCDSIEGITHSLCSTEFIMSRESYEWLNGLLIDFQPMQREFGRFRLEGAIMSKRDIKQLIDRNIVRSWTDPRLYTLDAIRRRGIPPAALLSFISELGVTTSISTITVKRFEQSIRSYLERTVPRLMMVLDPIRVVVEDGEEHDIELPFLPKDPTMGLRRLRFTGTIYIDRSDFREADSPDYFRLAPGKCVGLLQAPFPIRAVSFSKHPETGVVEEVRAVFDKSGQKPKAYIQWVPDESLKAEARIYNPLFNSAQPKSAPGGFLSDVNPSSEVVWPNAMIEYGFEAVRRRAPWPEAEGERDGECGPESVRFQAMRIGYFACDSDTTDDKIVLNRIVSLKEDSSKT